MLKKVLLTLFTGYTMSSFIFYYVPLKSILILFLATTLLTAIVCFKFLDTAISRVVINLSTAIQITYLFVFFFFEKLQYQVPDWLHKDETLTAIFLALFTLLGGIKNEKAKLILHDVSVATAMGLSLVLAIQSVYPFPNALYMFPIVSSLFILLFVKNKEPGFWLVLLTTAASIGIAFGLPTDLNAFQSDYIWTTAEIVYSNTWIVAMIMGLLFANSLLKQKPTPAESTYIPRRSYADRSSYRTSDDSYSGNRNDNDEDGYSYNSTYADERKEKKSYDPFGDITNNNNRPEIGSSTFFMDKEEEDPNYFGMSDCQIQKKQDEEFYGMHPLDREKIIEEREYGLPAYQRTDDLDDD